MGGARRREDRVGLGSSWEGKRPGGGGGGGGGGRERKR